MAEIPLLNLVSSAPEQIDDGSRVSYAASGKVRIARMFDVTRTNFRLGWQVLSADQFAALRAFYNANRFVDVEYTDPFTSLSYSVKMLTPPQVIDKTSSFVTVEMEIAGVLA